MRKVSVVRWCEPRRSEQPRRDATPTLHLPSPGGAHQRAHDKRSILKVLVEGKEVFGMRRLASLERLKRNAKRGVAKRGVGVRTRLAAGRRLLLLLGRTLTIIRIVVDAAGYEHSLRESRPLLLSGIWLAGSR